MGVHAIDCGVQPANVIVRHGVFAVCRHSILAVTGCVTQIGAGVMQRQCVCRGIVGCPQTGVQAGVNGCVTQKLGGVGQRQCVSRGFVWGPPHPNAHTVGAVMGGGPQCCTALGVGQMCWVKATCAAAGPASACG